MSLNKDLLSPFDYTSAMATTPESTAASATTSAPSRSPSPRKESASPSSSRAPTSEPLSEEERRRSRKREQNRESQRAFRRRQENRVKFLEGKTLELEAASRFLRAENAQLREQLRASEGREGALVAMMGASQPPSPFEFAQEAPVLDGGDLIHSAW